MGHVQCKLNATCTIVAMHKLEYQADTLQQQKTLISMYKANKKHVA